MLGDLPRGKSQTALAWGLRGRFHQCPKRDKNGDNDPGLGAQGFGCLHPTRLHPWVCLQESPWPHPRQHLRAQSARACAAFVFLEASAGPVGPVLSGFFIPLFLIRGGYKIHRRPNYHPPWPDPPVRPKT